MKYQNCFPSNTFAWIQVQKKDGKINRSQTNINLAMFGSLEEAEQYEKKSSAKCGVTKYPEGYLVYGVLDGPGGYPIKAGVYHVEAHAAVILQFTVQANSRVQAAQMILDGHKPGMRIADESESFGVITVNDGDGWDKNLSVFNTDKAWPSVRDHFQAQAPMVNNLMEQMLDDESMEIKEFCLKKHKDFMLRNIPNDDLIEELEGCGYQVTADEDRIDVDSPNGMYKTEALETIREIVQKEGWNALYDLIKHKNIMAL